ncbi:hypothetical protein H7K13_23825 [Priestia aryabhattai]|uniref:hypothetical protein n=1 Tax=Priestia aryabhattai TaxID=412384 RepID=UPI001C8DD5B0|nr:hypothetical protein [Priestia aryabhattai]MBY0077959.1 hypothetical protein [Priestia aryabhattai]
MNAQGYQVSSIDVRRLPNGQYYVGREVNINGRWKPYSIESEPTRDRDAAIKEFARMKTDEISRDVSKRLGSSEYQPIQKEVTINYIERTQRELAADRERIYEAERIREQEQSRTLENYGDPEPQYEYGFNDPVAEYKYELEQELAEKYEQIRELEQEYEDSHEPVRKEVPGDKQEHDIDDLEEELEQVEEYLEVSKALYNQHRNMQRELEL